MENGSDTISVDMQAEEVVALALCEDLIQNNPAVVKAILVQHEVQPSTDPEENILRLAKLSAARGRFFNEDFDKAVQTAGYYRTENMPDVLSKYVARHKDIKTFRSGYFKIGDLFKKKEGGTKVGNLLKNIFKKPTDETAPALAPGDVADSEGGKELMKKVEEQGDGDDKDKDKKDLIIGLKPVVFYSALGGVIILIIVIIILIVRANRKKKAEAKKE